MGTDYDNHFKIGLKKCDNDTFKWLLPESEWILDHSETPLSCQAETGHRTFDHLLELPGHDIHSDQMLQRENNQRKVITGAKTHKIELLYQTKAN